MDETGRSLVRLCHAEAMRRGLYDSGCYMGSCADEYWAEATQSWFDATVRTDVNCGVNTREKIQYSADPIQNTAKTELVWVCRHDSAAAWQHGSSSIARSNCASPLAA